MNKNRIVKNEAVRLIEEKMSESIEAGMNESYILGLKDAANIIKNDLMDRCLYCYQGVLKPIIYGYPSGDLLTDPNVIIGGCSITLDDPTYACGDCGSYFWDDGRSQRF